MAISIKRFFSLWTRRYLRACNARDFFCLSILPTCRSPHYSLSANVKQCHTTYVAHSHVTQLQAYTIEHIGCTMMQDGWLVGCLGFILKDRQIKYL